MGDESGEWLTYIEAGDRLGVSPEAVRAKVARKRWRRQIGNDGRARVWLPEDERPPVDRPVTGQSPPARENEREPGDHPVTIRSPRGHRPVDPALVTALESHIKTLQGENETLMQQLTASEARAERQASDFAARDAQRAADLAAEQAKTTQAICAFADLARRLDVLAEAN